MKLQKLSLRNFRNYFEGEFEFADEINQFIGDNAQGKTNLLEAIAFCITGRSFRTSHLSDLIRDGADRCVVEATFLKHGMPQTIRITYGKEKEVLHNETRLPSFTGLLGLMQGVLFSPEDHGLISGPPAQRRRFLDLHLAQLDPLYVHHLQRYLRALKQRNALLKEKQTATLDTWEAQLAESALYISTQRLRAVEELQKEIVDFGDEMEIRLKLTVRNLDGYLEAYRSHRERELLFGNTMIGPHREELLITLEGREARLFGSQGQKNCAALSLRLAEWKRLRNLSGEFPLLLLDDLGASLSKSRQAAVAQHLQDVGQSFVTANESSGTGKIFEIRSQVGGGVLKEHQPCP